MTPPIAPGVDASGFDAPTPRAYTLRSDDAMMHPPTGRQIIVISDYPASTLDPSSISIIRSTSRDDRTHIPIRHHDHDHHDSTSQMTMTSFTSTLSLGNSSFSSVGNHGAPVRAGRTHQADTAGRARPVPTAPPDGTRNVSGVFNFFCPPSHPSTTLGQTARRGTETNPVPVIFLFFTPLSFLVVPPVHDEGMAAWPRTEGFAFDSDKLAHLRVLIAVSLHYLLYPVRNRPTCHALFCVISSPPAPLAQGAPGDLYGLFFVVGDSRLAHWRPGNHHFTHCS